MRSHRLGPDAFLLASKKPRIIDLVARCHLMSVDEIRGLPEKPDTIRGLLLIKELGTSKLPVAEKIANAMERFGSAPPAGNISMVDCTIWKLSVDIWVDVGASSIEAKAGWYWAHLADRRTMIGNSLIKDLKTAEKLIPISQLHGKGTISDLKKLEYDRVQKIPPSFIIDLTR